MSRPFKADVVGSLLRPQSILDARADFNAGKLSREDLWKKESAAIGEAVALQKSAGLKVATDGEYHRRHWFMDFVERIDGIALEGGLKTAFQNEEGFIEMRPPVVVTKRKLKRVRPLALDEFNDLKPHADRAGVTPKQAIPSPTLVHFRDRKSTRLNSNHT